MNLYQSATLFGIKTITGGELIDVLYCKQMVAPGDLLTSILHCQLMVATWRPGDICLYTSEIFKRYKVKKKQYK